MQKEKSVRQGCPENDNMALIDRKFKNSDECQVCFLEKCIYSILRDFYNYFSEYKKSQSLVHGHCKIMFLAVLAQVEACKGSYLVPFSATQIQQSAFVCLPGTCLVWATSAGCSRVSRNI
jgi:hypothetical protein